MKRRQSSAHRNVHSSSARASANAAWNRGLKSSSDQSATQPYSIDMEALIYGLQFASSMDISEVRRTLEHHAVNNPLGLFLKDSIQRIIDSPKRYAEEQNQAAAQQ